MAKVEILAKGNEAQIFIDGVKVPDVRGYSISHTVGNLPVFKLDVRADDILFGGCGFIPDLPEIFKPFYKRIEQKNGLEIDAKAVAQVLPSRTAAEHVKGVRHEGEQLQKRVRGLEINCLILAVSIIILAAGGILSTL